MFKCTDCGHIFEDGEQRTFVERHPYGDTTADEYFSVCPVCGGEYEEAKSCECCGGAFLEDELIGGYYCDECLRDSVTCGSFETFAMDGIDERQTSTLEDFVLRKLFDIDDSGEILTHSSYRLKGYFRSVYRRAAIGTTGENDLLEKIYNYMAEYKLWDDFAEYLHEREVKK